MKLEAYGVVAGTSVLLPLCWGGAGGTRRKGKREGEGGRERGRKEKREREKGGVGREEGKGDSSGANDLPRDLTFALEYKQFVS